MKMRGKQDGKRTGKVTQEHSVRNPSLSLPEGSSEATSLEVKELISVTQLLSVLALSSSHYTAETRGRAESIAWMHTLEPEQDMALFRGNVSAF